MHDGQAQAHTQPAPHAQRPLSPPKAVGVGSPARPPRLGSWLWTCRVGFETHLFLELARTKSLPEVLGPGLVASARRPAQDAAFARTGFLVRARASGPLAALVAALAPRLARAGPLTVRAWSADSEEGQKLLADAEALEAALRAAPGVVHRDTGTEPFAEVVLVGTPSAFTAVYGTVRREEAVSWSPAGRARMHRSGDTPSRAGLKLEEAWAWLGLWPSAGETCVDLGAAPGGWTARALHHGARVVAVDRAALAPEVARNPRLRHLRESAFAYRPEEPVDWLLCDMAWRPLEVAALLARWGQQGWAVHLVANLKLPMRDKVETLARARGLLEEAGWKALRMRQLYHDRDEVTVVARSR
jgi:23S rRNA (cytidine2498-2'-O)-methyltransferase